MIGCVYQIAQTPVHLQIDSHGKSQPHLLGAKWQQSILKQSGIASAVMIISFWIGNLHFLFGCGIPIGQAGSLGIPTRRPKYLGRRIVPMAIFRVVLLRRTIFDVVLPKF